MSDSIILSCMSVISCLSATVAVISSRTKKKLYLLLISVFLLHALFGAVSAYEVYIGESVDLGGSCTSDNVYLFITGPNLPSNGANPENIHEAVITGDPSSFLKVNAFNNRWSYTWDTRTAGGNPDSGIYTIYAVERPVGRYDLSGADYSAKTVRLIDPSISVSEISSSFENNGEQVTSEGTETADENAATKTAATPSPTSLPAEDSTGTQQAGLSPVLLIISFAITFAVVLIRVNRSKKI